MTRRRSVVCAGYMPLDVIRAPGGAIARRAGGTAGNVAAILAFLGWDATLAGQTGDDPAAKELLADLKAVGVDVAQVRRTASSLAPRLVHDVRPEGHFFKYSCPECGSRFPRSRPLTLEGAAECAEAHPSPTVYFFDRASRATLWLAEHYAAQGTVIVFEPSIPANAEFLGRAASVAHVVKHSDDRSVGGLDDLHVKPRPGQFRIVTHGAEGLDVRVGAAGRRRFPALATLAVDTGGAGDWMTAGFLTRAAFNGQLARGSLEDAVRFGQALAAVNCATIGSRGLMAMSRDGALRRARRVLLEGGLTSMPRLPRATARPRGAGGACQACLMPTVDQLELISDPVTAVG